MRHSERLDPVIIRGRERMLWRVLADHQVRCGLCEQHLYMGDTYTRRKLQGEKGAWPICEGCEPRDELRDPAREITHPRKRAFLAAFAQNGNVTASCRMVGLDRGYLYQWRAADPDFAAAMDKAKLASIEVLEAAALRMALTGDGATLRFLLKAHKPELYGDHVKVDATNVHAGIIAVRPQDFTDGELEAIQQALRAKQQRTIEQGERLALPPGKD